MPVSDKIHRRKPFPVIEKFYSSVNAPARASIFYTAGNIISRGAAFLITPVLTRLLGSEDYGLYSLFNSVLSILTIFSTLDIPGSVFFRGMQKFKGERAYFLRSSLILISILSPLSFVAYTIISKGVFGGEIFIGANILLLISLLANGTVNLYSSFCKFKSKYLFPTLTGIVTGAAAPALACLAAALFSPNGANALWVKVVITTAICALFALPVYIYILRSGKTPQTKDKENGKRDTLCHIKFLLLLALPMIPYYLSLSAIAQGDKIIISRFLGKAALGSYSVAYSAGSAIAYLISGICAALSPWIMRKVRAGEVEKIRRVILLIWKVISPITLLFLCLSPEIFAFLAPKEYSYALSAVFPIALSAAPHIFSTLLCSASLSYEKTGGIILSGVIPASVSILLNILLVPKYSIFSAGVITLISYTLSFLLSAFNFKRLSGKNGVFVNSCLQNLLFCIFCAMAIFAFREYLIIRIFAAFISLLALLRGFIYSKKLLREGA